MDVIMDLLKLFSKQKTMEVYPSGGQSVPSHVAIGSALKRRPTSRFGNDQSPKRGMWVVYKGKVGILKMIEVGDVATVTLVDALGLGESEIHVPADQLRQAYLDEIPEPRRPSLKVAATFGYYKK